MNIKPYLVCIQLKLGFKDITGWHFSSQKVNYYNIIMIGKASFLVYYSL